METSQLICRANQLTGFNMRETLAFNGLSLPRENIWILMTRWLNNIWVLITPDIFWNSSLMPSKMQYPSHGQVNRSSVFVGNHLEMVTQKKNTGPHHHTGWHQEGNLVIKFRHYWIYEITKSIEILRNWTAQMGVKIFKVKMWCTVGLVSDVGLVRLSLSD